MILSICRSDGDEDSVFKGEITPQAHLIVSSHVRSSVDLEHEYMVKF